MGSEQSDAMQRMTGQFNGRGFLRDGSGSGDGVFSLVGTPWNQAMGDSINYYSTAGIGFDNANQVRTADENRGKNRASLGLIKVS